MIRLTILIFVSLVLVDSKLTLHDLTEEELVLNKLQENLLILLEKSGIKLNEEQQVDNDTSDNIYSKISFELNDIISKFNQINNVLESPSSENLSNEIQKHNSLLKELENSIQVYQKDASFCYKSLEEAYNYFNEMVKELEESNKDNSLKTKTGDKIQAKKVVRKFIVTSKCNSNNNNKVVKFCNKLREKQVKQRKSLDSFIDKSSRIKLEKIRHNYVTSKWQIRSNNKILDICVKELQTISLLTGFNVNQLKDSIKSLSMIQTEMIGKSITDTVIQVQDILREIESRKQVIKEMITESSKQLVSV